MSSYEEGSEAMMGFEGGTIESYLMSFTPKIWERGQRRTMRTPSLMLVRTSTQTFLPSSHLLTAEEKRYERRRPVTAYQLASQPRS